MATNTFGFTKEQVAEYKAQFDAFDEDGGGSIDTTELKSVLTKCGMTVTDAQVAELVKEFDADGSGTLEFEEFLAMMHKMSSGPTEKDVRKSMFEIFDENLDGLISVSDLAALWKRAASESGGKLDVVPEDVLKALIAEADGDGDGMLNEDEFAALVDACS